MPRRHSGRVASMLAQAAEGQGQQPPLPRVLSLLYLNGDMCFLSAALRPGLSLSPLPAACPRPSLLLFLGAAPSSWQTSAGPSRPMAVLGPVQRCPLLGMCRNPRRREHLAPGA